jgi:hypothetical protein
MGFKVTKIVQIATTRDGDNSTNLYVLYEDGRLFERLNTDEGDHIWYRVIEPEKIIKERESQEKPVSLTHTGHLCGERLFPITEEEWRKDECYDKN